MLNQTGIRELEFKESGDHTLRLENNDEEVRE
jgi:hypothetical protein